MGDASVSRMPEVVRRHGKAGVVSRLLLRLDNCVCEAYQTGVFQSTIVHAVVLLTLALSVTVTEDCLGGVRLTICFSSPAVAPDQLPSEMQESLVELPDAAAAGMDAAVASLVVEPAITASMVVDAVHDIALTGFDQPESATDVGVRALLAELPAAVPGDPLSRRAARAASLRPAEGRARVNIDMANGAGVDGMRVSGTGAGAGGEIGGEIGRRLAAAGAQTGDVQISIVWDGINDIDLHVQVEPLQGGMASWISWMSRVGFCGGMLDVDANAVGHRLTPTPVENVFWAKGSAPYGRYTIAVHHYRSWSGEGTTPVEVAVLVDGQLLRFYPLAVEGNSPKVVHSFVRRPSADAVYDSTNGR